ncbi:MAG: 3-deoxy-manno-octulosonate cytidylyltransferase [Xanthomonadales bacterium]|nr:3-deoxy-manno-octulosonate cytidylyltransferase [Xanthomonadales bacterium]
MTSNTAILSSVKVVIPARLASTRLPNKPLVEIAGRSMLEWVWRRAVESAVGEVVIATDSEQIMQLASGFGADAALTQQTHLSGTDRCAEVATQRGWSDDTLVINLQGDEPQIPTACLQQMAALISEYPEAVCSLYEPIVEREVFHDPAAVKVVCDQRERALYFSRAPIPHDRDQTQDGTTAMLGRRHIGLYAYSVARLRAFTELPSSPYEQREKLEQLRLLEHGIPIQMARCCAKVPAGIDTPADLARVRASWPKG